MGSYFLYAHDRCDRCGKITSVRSQSYFTDHTVCMACLAEEGLVMAGLRQAGSDPADYEGCGCIPDPSRPDPCTCPETAEVPPKVRITAADLRGALRRLRARSELVRIPPGFVWPGRHMPPSM